MAKHPDIIQLAKKGQLDLLAQVIERPEFFAQAECSPETADLFFAEEPCEIAEAKAICGSCPIQQQCLEWAVLHEDDGIYGGTTPQERELIRNGSPVIDLDSVRRMQADRAIIMTKPVKVVAESFSVEPRTVHRWRNEISEAEQKAS
jgi:hypothetical protein